MGLAMHDVPDFLLASRRIWWLAALGLAVLLAPGQAAAVQTELTWVDNSGGQAAFAVERRTEAAGTYAVVGTSSPGVTAYSDASVVAGTRYCYRIRAYNSAGYSPYSNEACGTAGGTLDLTVVRTGTGTGTVSSTPAGISCGSDCFESFAAVTPVTITARPGTYTIFNGWSGGCSGRAPCTLTGNRAVTVRGSFSATYLLTVSVWYGPGTVSSSPAGITCGSDCWQRYVSGTSVTLTATPPAGATFLGWSGGCRGTAPCTLTLTANTSVWAFFFAP